jgi:L-seryl-tRNA(Ser) seleniumtransferase
VSDANSIFDSLGVRSVINAAGNTTSHGGSTPTASVKRAMELVENTWVDIQELLDASGARIAQLLEVDAAYITSGGYAALALSAAACIAGNDRGKQAQLPDATGLKNEVLLQEAQRYVFDRAYTVGGGSLSSFGDEQGASATQLEDAIGSNTAAVAYYVKQQPEPGELSLEETVRIANVRGVPVIVDAASRIWPLDYFKQMANSGDLVCFGGKYVGAPQSAGFVCGKKDLVAAVRDMGYVSAKPLGRAMKLDTQEIVGLLTGIEDWFSMDHDARFAEYDARMATIANGLEGAPNVIETKKVETARHPGVTMHVVLDTASLGKSVEEVVDDLYEGESRIRVMKEDEKTLNVCVHTLNEGEDRVVAQGLRQVLTKS